MRRSRSDWAEAGLAALAEQGLPGVAVEPLARRLGTTKGSFYWHFTDRSELVSAVLELWERRDTIEVIERIEALTDPRERLVALGTGAVAGAATGNAHAAVVAAAGADPAIALVLRRVTRTRLAFLTRLYRDLRLPQEEAGRRAHIAYAVYLGVEQLRRTGLDAESGGVRLGDLVDLAVELVLPNRPDGWSGAGPG